MYLGIIKKCQYNFYFCCLIKYHTDYIILLRHEWRQDSKSWVMRWIFHGISCNVNLYSEQKYTQNMIVIEGKGKLWKKAKYKNSKAVVLILSTIEWWNKEINKIYLPRWELQIELRQQKLYNKTQKIVLIILRKWYLIKSEHCTKPYIKLVS